MHRNGDGLVLYLHPSVTKDVVLSNYARATAIPRSLDDDIGNRISSRRHPLNGTRCNIPVRCRGTMRQYTDWLDTARSYASTAVDRTSCMVVAPGPVDCPLSFNS